MALGTAGKVYSFQEVHPSRIPGLRGLLKCPLPSTVYQLSVLTNALVLEQFLILFRFCCFSLHFAICYNNNKTSMTLADMLSNVLCTLNTLQDHHHLHHYPFVAENKHNHLVREVIFEFSTWIFPSFLWKNLRKSFSVKIWWKELTPLFVVLWDKVSLFTPGMSEPCGPSHSTSVQMAGVAPHLDLHNFWVEHFHKLSLQAVTVALIGFLGLCRKRILKHSS